MIEFKIEDDLLVRRICGRWFHLPSGRSYHEEFRPPKVPGVDDVTGEPLIRRADDNPETLKKRLAAYHNETKPLVHFYSKIGLHKAIDASLHTNDVFNNIKEIFDNAKSKFNEIRTQLSPDLPVLNRKANFTSTTISAGITPDLLWPVHRGLWGCPPKKSSARPPHDIMTLAHLWARLKSFYKYRSLCYRYIEGLLGMIWNPPIIVYLVSIFLTHFVVY